MVEYWVVRLRINEEAYGKGRKAQLIVKYIPKALVPREKIYDWVWGWCEKNLGGNFDFRITSVKEEDI